eukprot:7958855-Alexandrium_andersonii.AAC.1
MRVVRTALDGRRMRMRMWRRLLQTRLHPTPLETRRSLPALARIILGRPARLDKLQRTWRRSRRFGCDRDLGVPQRWA